MRRSIGRALPNAENGLAQAVARQRVHVPRNGHHELVPNRNLLLRGKRLLQEASICQRCQQPHGVEVFQSHQSEHGWSQRAESSFIIAAVMPDGLVERRKEPLVRRAEDHQVAAGQQVRGSTRHLSRIIVDVFQHVHIEDRVKSFVGLHVGNRPHAHLTATGQDPPVDRFSQPGGQGRVRLNAQPQTVPRTGQHLSASPQARPHFQHSVTQISNHTPTNISLPIRRRGKQIQFGADVAVSAHRRGLVLERSDIRVRAPQARSPKVISLPDTSVAH